MVMVTDCELATLIFTEGEAAAAPLFELLAAEMTFYKRHTFY